MEVMIAPQELGGVEVTKLASKERVRLRDDGPEETVGDAEQSVGTWAVHEFCVIVSVRRKKKTQWGCCNLH